MDKSKKSRVLKNVISLEVVYCFNKNLWMRSESFEKWILKLNRKMADKNSKIALVVSNCLGHFDVSSKLSNINSFSLPEHHFKIPTNGPRCNKKPETSLQKMHSPMTYLKILK